MNPTLLDAYEAETGRVEKYALSNGLKFIILEDHLAPVAAYQTWFGVGSGHEKKGSTGMAHLFEHLMFKETKNRKAGEFDRLLEANGVSTNAATWLDWTFYREELPSSCLPLVMQLESDRMEHMILNQDQLDTEREVVKNERRSRVDNDPEGKLYEELYQAHFGAHPYAHPTIGWMADIEGTRLEQCIDFYRDFYAPDNACVVVVGDVETAQVLDLAAKYYGHMKPSGFQQPAAVTARPGSGVTSVLELPVSSPRVATLLSAPSIADPAGTAFHVLNEFMLNSDSSRLQKLLVEELELATDVNGWYGAFRMSGAFEILLSVVPGGNWEHTLDRVWDGIDQLVQSGSSQREADKGVNRVEMSIMRGQMTVGTRARNLGHYETTAGDFKALYRMIDRARSCTPAEVHEVAAGYLKREQSTTIVGVPTGGQS